MEPECHGVVYIIIFHADRALIRIIAKQDFDIRQIRAPFLMKTVRGAERPAHQKNGKEKNGSFEYETGSHERGIVCSAQNSRITRESLNAE